MRLQVGVYKSIHRIMVLIVIGGLFVLTACSTSERMPPIGSQHFPIGSEPFIVDTSDGKQTTSDETVKFDQKPLLKLLTPDKKKKLEIFEGGHTELYEWRIDKWEWVQGAQGGLSGNNSAVMVIGPDEFGVLEVIDPNIIKVEFESEKDKKQLAFIEIGSHRFIAYQKDPRNKDYYQIRGVSKDGKILWQLFPDGYWGGKNIEKK
jgi:hypothetical protein